jgi:hypothetical protein
MSLSDKLLEQSNSYNYYKTKYEKFAKDNKKLKEKIMSLEKSNGEYEEEIAFLKERILETEEHTKNVANEIHYAFVFNDTIRGSKWLKETNFSLINASANYSLMYYIYRVLDEVNPKNILELGLGQTTRLTSQYANYFNDVKLTVIEEDEQWIKTFSDNIDLNDNIKIVQRDIEEFEFDGSINLRFKDFSEVTGNEKYDLIIIDAPHGYIKKNGVTKVLDYPRSNVWQLIPDNLAENFAIIMDDYERQGEQNTMEHVKKLLKENGIRFFRHSHHGLKFQHAVFSRDYKFLAWY